MLSDFHVKDCWDPIDNVQNAGDSFGPIIWMCQFNFEKFDLIWFQSYMFNMFKRILKGYF